MEDSPFYGWFLGTIYGTVEYGILGDAEVYPSTQNIYGGLSQIAYILIGSASLGFIVGMLEVFAFKKLFNGRPFSFKIIFKSIFYSLLIDLFLIVFGAIFTSHRLGLSMLDSEVIQSQIRFVSNFAFISIFIYISFAFIISLFILEMSKNLGLMVFYNFVTGKYHKPSVEDRVFMFMDMKSSTTIAEQLGHVKYYELLNKYYADISDAIINANGEIYQYVGDEVIISWPLKLGVKGNNCIKCFLQIKKAISSRSEEYIQKFDAVPTFKAGLHCGQVTTGEIGELKKEIVFSGDVLNTTSRIQGLCNQYNAELLTSSELIELLDTKENLSISEIGAIELRGKQEKVIINKIQFN